MKYLIAYLLLSIPVTLWVCRILRRERIRLETRERMNTVLRLCDWAENRANPSDIIHEDYDEGAA